MLRGEPTDMDRKPLKAHEVLRKGTQQGSNESNLSTACSSIVSRLEVLPDRQAKIWFRVIYAGVGLSLLLLLLEVALKHSGTFENKRDRMKIVEMNVAIALVCFIAMVCSSIHYVYR